MSTELRLDVSGDQQISQHLASLREAIDPRRLNQRIGLDVTNLFQGHYRSLPSNKMGGKTTNFWKGAARSTHFKPDDKGVAVITSQQGVLQRLRGGVIRAVHAKFLAIPARAEAYGKSPRDFDNLHFVPTRSGGMLVESDATKVKLGRKKKDGSRTVTNLGTTGGGVMFWLRKSVNQIADPNVIPTDERIGEAVRFAVQDHLSLLTGGAS